MQLLQEARDKVKKRKLKTMAIIEKYFDNEEQKVMSCYTVWAAESNNKCADIQNELESAEQELSKAMDGTPKEIVKNHDSMLGFSSALRNFSRPQDQEVHLPSFHLQVADMTDESRIEIMLGNLRDCLVKGYSTLTQLKQKGLTLLKKFELSDVCNKLLVTNGMLFCLMRTKIEVRNASTGELVRSVNVSATTANLNKMTGADVAPNGDIYITVGSNGLFRYNRINDSIQQVAEGFYYSLLVIGSQMIAVREDIESDEGLYFDYFCIDGAELTKLLIKKANLMWKEGMAVVTLVGNTDKTFVCSWRDHQVHEFNNDLQIKRSFGRKGWSKPGELFGPRLCTYESSSGLVLVTDKGNDRLQILDLKSGEWTIVKSDQEITIPTSAVISEDRKLYCVGYNNPNILCLCEITM